MTIQIDPYLLYSNLITPIPLNNQRQVPTDTAIIFEISGVTEDGYAPDLSTISVQINGTYAIKNGVFQLPSVIYGTSTEALGPVPEESTRFFITPRDVFKVGDKIEVTDSINSIQTPIISIVPADIEGQVVIEFKDALLLQPLSQRLPDYQLSLTSLSRGYVGSLGSTTTINALSLLPTNAIIFLTIEVAAIAPTMAIPNTALIPLPPQRIRKVFTFRTLDTQPPQIIDFPTVIHNSNLSFKLVDFAQNPIDLDSISVSLNEDPAIRNGMIQSDFMGSITLYPETTTAEVYIRPKQKYNHLQPIRAIIQAADGYGNTATHTRNFLNHSVQPQVEFINCTPTNEGIIDPLDPKVVIALRVTETLNTNFINLFYEVDGQLNPDTNSSYLPIIENGRFVNSESFIATYGEQSGEILAGSRDILITVNALKAVTFNKKIKITLVLQEVTDLGDVPVGVPPFYQKTFNFTSISAPLSPIVDRFFPTSDTPVSATTQIRCRVRSQVQGAPIDFDSLRITVNNAITAVDQGQFKNSWTGSIVAAQNSQNHTANIILNQPAGSSFDIGATVAISITAADVAGNAVTTTFSFTVADTSAPVVTITPSGGVFKKLTRIRIEADQPATIYYTMDGSKPEIGNIATLMQVSPITNVPIFAEGVTQIKAFAISTSSVAGPTTTAIFDLNPFVPEITILSPSQNQMLDSPSIGIQYKILLRRGFLTSVEISVNNGPLFNTQNTLPESTVSVSGLRPGTNTVELIATDNAGNVGRSLLTIGVKASQITNFSLKFAPLQCPEFTLRPIPSLPDLFSTIDTTTIAIIGLGSRTETLVSFGIGNGADGSPVNFAINAPPDGRHFTVKSFPIQTHKLFLYRKGRTFEVPPRDYVLNTASGQLVLDHPIEVGEGLTIEYVSESDINTPTIFTPTQLPQLYAKHGSPSLQNTLSLAAQMAFENGATRILAIQAEQLAVDSFWSKSFEALAREEAYWIVPILRNEDLSFYPAILQATYNHVESLSNIRNRKERIVAGWRMPNALNEFRDARVFLASLDQNPKLTRTINGEIATINGTFIAAAIAGRISSLTTVATPLTNNTITGFSMQTTKRSPKLDLQREIDQGFMPVQALASGASIYRGRTSYVGPTSPVREELSIQRTIDLISKELRVLADNRFRGQLLTSATIKNIALEIQSFLKSKSSIISKGTLTNLEIDSKEPRQLNIEVAITPLYPLNEFSIVINVIAGV